MSLENKDRPRDFEKLRMLMWGSSGLGMGISGEYWYVNVCEVTRS